MITFREFFIYFSHLLVSYVCVSLSKAEDRDPEPKLTNSWSYSRKKALIPNFNLTQVAEPRNSYFGN